MARQVTLHLRDDFSIEAYWADGIPGPDVDDWTDALPLALQADPFEVERTLSALCAPPKAWSARVVGVTGSRTFALAAAEHGGGTCLHVCDVTEAVEDALEARRSEWIHTLGQFAHQIRNPLAGITGALQVFGMEVDKDDPRSDVMSMVLDEGFRLNRLVGDLVTIARGVEPHRQQVQLREIVDEVADALAGAHPSLEVRVVGDATWSADPALLHRIVLELFENAHAAAGDEGVIDVEIEGDALSVRDSGPGVPAELLDRVFEPMFSTKERGMGLGLAVSRSHATSLGYTLTYERDRRAFVLRNPA